MDPVSNQLTNLETFANSSNYYLRVEEDGSVSANKKTLWWSFKNIFCKSENENLNAVEHRITIFLINNPSVWDSSPKLFQKLPLSSEYTNFAKVSYNFYKNEQTKQLATQFATMFANECPDLDELD